MAPRPVTPLWSGASTRPRPAAAAASGAGGNGGLGARKRNPAKPPSQGSLSSDTDLHRRPRKKAKTGAAGRGALADVLPDGDESGGADVSEAGEESTDWDRYSLRSELARQAAEPDPLKLAAFCIFVPAAEHPDRDVDVPMDGDEEYSPLPVQLFQGLLAQPRLSPGSCRDPGEYQLETVLERIRAHGIPCTMRSHYLSIPPPAGYRAGACSINFPVTISNEKQFYDFIHDLSFAGRNTISLLEDGSFSGPLKLILRRVQAVEAAPPRLTLEDLLGPAEVLTDQPALPPPPPAKEPVASSGSPGPIRGDSSEDDPHDWTPRTPVRVSAQPSPPPLPQPSPLPLPQPSPQLQSRPQSEKSLLASGGTPTPVNRPTVKVSQHASVTGSGRHPILVGSSSPSEPDDSVSEAGGTDSDSGADLQPDDENEEPLDIMETAKSSQALNAIIRTPDNHTFWKRTADYFNLPPERVGPEDGAVLVGTKLLARPQQYIDTWIILHKMASPKIRKVDQPSDPDGGDQLEERISGIMLGHTVGIGKTRQMFLVTAVLRLVYLCHVDVKQHPVRHIGGDASTDRQVCPSEWKFGIRCVCNRNGLSGRLARSPRVSVQHSFPHMFITGANLVSQAFSDAEAFFEKEIASPFFEDGAKVLRFVKLVSLHGESKKTTDGERAIKPFRKSMVFSKDNAPVAHRATIDLQTLAAISKYPEQYRYHRDLENPATQLSYDQLKAQIKPPWAVESTCEAKSVGDPLYLVFVSRHGISQKDMTEGLRLSSVPRSIELKRSFGKGRGTRSVSLQPVIGIDCGVVFHDEFHLMSGTGTNFGERLAMLAKNDPPPFFILSSASVVGTRLESLASPLSLLLPERETKDIKDMLKAFENEVNTISEDWTKTLRRSLGKNPDINKHKPFVDWVNRFGTFLRALLVRRDQFSTVMGKNITPPLPEMHAHNRNLDSSEEAQTDYMNSLDALRKQLSDKQRTIIADAKAVSQSMLRQCFQGLSVYGRMQLASYFPATLRPGAPVLPTVANELYSIIKPVLDREKLPQATDIEGDAEKWREWDPPIFHDQRAPPPPLKVVVGSPGSRSTAPDARAANPNTAQAAQLPSYRVMIADITKLASPVTKCPRVAEVYKIITQYARSDFETNRPNSPASRAPPQVNRGIIMLDTPAMAFYVAVALQLCDEEEYNRSVGRKNDLRRQRLQVMFIPAVSRVKKDRRVLAAHWLARRSAHDASHDVIKVLVTTFGALGTGLDGLQKTCSFIIYPMTPSSATVEEQADGRIHRTGQQYETAKYTITIKGDPYDMLRTYARMKLAIRDGDNNINLPLIKGLLGPVEDSGDS